MSVITFSDIQQFSERRSLKLDGCDSLSLLAQNSDIEMLCLRHFPKLRSLEPLRKLKKLRYLSLSTDIGWDGTNRHLIVDSFEPLVGLKKLELLEIIGVVPKKGRLQPLSRIPTLRKISIGVTNFYRLEDFAMLSEKLPLARSSVQPIYQYNFITRCRKCHEHPLLSLAGPKPRSPRLVCPACGIKKIVAHLERWNRAGGLPTHEASTDLQPAKLLELFGNPNAK
jgi:hypothetical protein